MAVLSTATLAALAIRTLKACSGRPVVAFFHPNSNGGGGGERVLWLAVKAVDDDLRRRRSPARVVIYSGDSDVGQDALLAKAKSRFGIDLSGSSVEMVFFSTRWLLDPGLYPALTMLGQSLGGMLCTAECVVRCPPTVFVDTMGAPFGYPVAALLSGATVACYTHYPVITPEMTRVVAEGRAAHNNRHAAASPVRTWLKLAYYRVFAAAYARCGAFCDVVMANSSWTAGHLSELWGGAIRRSDDSGAEGGAAAGAARLPLTGLASAWDALFGTDDLASADIQVVFPPCNSEAMAMLPLRPARRALPAKAQRLPWVVSVGQFRPEKDHSLQLRAFAEAARGLACKPWAGEMRLVLVGGARNAQDQRRVDALKAEAKALGIADRVQWRINAPFEGPGSLCEALELGAAGLHCMWNEHFGIAVVESQAAGCVPVAHDSGGPRLDIVVPTADGRRTGCRARSPAGFGQALAAVLCASQEGTAAYLPLEEDGAEGPSPLLRLGATEPGSGSIPRPEELDFCAMQVGGRAAAMRFADVKFERDFLRALRSVTSQLVPPYSARPKAD
ncbi:hypothetical protein FNF29_06999 [Cafeteria roenbergensis]|uniref:GDP-Man:Man(3)GlcNAc(2)-PP-Dol alpha-1,2-mannosyltransferase n=1 Tax=Cafeteria roenbergensis TaxID=33653 RepID=A0A5A8C729_CAFRO|nr:hypothetical protein FNF29_06999 [Cafeteria roenbergensis]|eukprot:KAA0147910.1 hypothetical protein FNF29_06999 [Cafeteria roenbergensis]